MFRVHKTKNPKSGLGVRGGVEKSRLMMPRRGAEGR